MKSLTPSEHRKELLLAKMKRKDLEKQHEATSRLKQQEAIIKEQQHLIEKARKQREIKFEIDRKEQEYRLKIEKSRLEMKRFCKDDQHLELAASVDRRSDRVNDWVEHAL